MIDQQVLQQLAFLEQETEEERDEHNRLAQELLAKMREFNALAEEILQEIRTDK